MYLFFLALAGHFTVAALLSGGPMISASPKPRDLCSNSDVLSQIFSPGPSSCCQVSTSLWPLSIGASTATESMPSPVACPCYSQSQASTAFHKLFMPSKPVPSVWPLHIITFGCQYEGQPWQTVEHSSCADSEETLLDFISVMLVSS